MQLTTVKDLCTKQGTPYFEFSQDCPKPALVGQRLYEFRSPLVYAGQLKDVHIFGRSFIHTKDNQYVFHNQSFQNHQQFAWKECAEEFIQKRTDLFADYIEDECVFLGGMNLEPASIDGPGNANFGHFHFEYLNRLVMFAAQLQLGRLPVVVYDTLPERYLEWLELFGVEHVIRVPARSTPAFKNVWVSSAPHYRGSDGTFRIWHEGLHKIRATALATFHKNRATAPRRVYLGRQDASWRKVVNEAEVEAKLREYGFVCPKMQDLSPWQQLEQVIRAEIIVTAAGANSILTHYAPHNCVVIPMFPNPAMGTGPWGGLGASLVLGQIYDRLDGEEVPTDIVQPNVAGVNEKGNFKVDISALESKVQQAIQYSMACWGNALVC